MRIEIGRSARGCVCIVVDVLRASSTIVTMLERGGDRVVVAEDVAAARKLNERLPDHLLCGEAGGLPPEGFDYGNSPAEFSRLDLSGKSVILATTNGTRTLSEVAESAAAVLVGCLLNLTAVTRAAVGLAEKTGAGITIACAGDVGSSEEDFAVGRAIIAIVEGAAAGDVQREVRESGHADALRRIGLAEDVEYCARLDVSDVVPVLFTENGLLMLKCHSPLSSWATLPDN